MQLFHCPACKESLYFSNTVCRCGQEVTFDPESQAMTVAQTPCKNRAQIDCNWTAENGDLCRSCSMTKTVPDLDAPENVARWRTTEAAKRWMLANLGRWGWFGAQDTGGRPEFHLLSEETSHGQAKVTMGHANGVITINVIEADEEVRAKRQAELGEFYRTMLGHMRHEMAHYLFVRLQERDGFTEDFRALFGDERADYGEALQTHYKDPKPAGEDFISSYATAHPHEDWAETVAHLLHLVDLLDSAMAMALSLPETGSSEFDAYTEVNTDEVLNRAVQISIAVNHVNRAMNLPDLYPFVLTSGVRKKLALAHDYLRTAA